MSSKERHDAAVEQLAIDLRQDGYRVVVGPCGDELPAPLRDLRPDLLASRGGQHIVYEVKLRGGPTRSYEELRRRVEAIPGHSFRLFFAGDDDRDLDFPPPSEETIRKALSEPERLHAEGNAAAALLLSWSLFEAAARRRMVEDENDPKRGVTPEGLIMRLIHLGYLDDGDLTRLRAVIRARNRAAHGDLDVQVEPVALADLRRATEALLSLPAAA